MPFGASVEYIPRTVKDKSETHQFDKKTRSGLFLGYVLNVSGGGGWTGDLLTADSEDLQETETADIFLKRFRHNGVFVKDSFVFLCAGELNLLGRPAPSIPPAAGNCSREGDHDGIEVVGVKESLIKDSWYLSSDSTFHEEPRAKLYTSEVR